MTNPKKNFKYNMIYQVLILIIPFITTPYLARVVGAKGVGIYSYTYSIVYYFMMLTLLGVNNYGNRMIAKVRNDEKELSKTFWSIYLFQLFMGLIMLIIYLIYIILFCNSYKNIAFIQVIYIVSSIFDINWLFFGLEEFKKTVTRNIFIKIITVILIFMFVKHVNDLWKYTLIMSGMTCVSQFVLWLFLKNKIKFDKVTFQDIRKHLKSNLVLFVPVIAISLYKIMDKIMLGVLTNIIEVGYYENAEKVVNIPITIISALGTVMLPRISNLVVSGNKEEIHLYIEKSLSFIMFMSFAMCAGLIVIGKNFAPLFFGKEFEKSGILIVFLSTTLPFISFANVIRTQYLIPYEKDKIYIASVLVGALVNLFFNIIFISKFESIGACIGTIAAEFVVMLYQVLSIRKELDFKKYLKNITPFLIRALCMLIIINVFNYIEFTSIIRLLIQIVLGGLIYGLLNIKYVKEILKIDKFKSC